MGSSNENSSSGLPAASGSNLGAKTTSANRSEAAKFRKGKELMRCTSDEVQWVSERLRNLEEEGEMMKHDFMESLEERKMLMNEISHQFRVIGHYQVTNGLSQVLQLHEFNPSLVIRNVKATKGESADKYEFLT